MTYIHKHFILALSLLLILPNLVWASDVVSSSDPVSSYDCPDHRQGEILVKVKDQSFNAQIKTRSKRKKRRNKHHKKNKKLLAQATTSSTSLAIDETLVQSLIQDQVPGIDILGVSKIHQEEATSPSRPVSSRLSANAQLSTRQAKQRILLDKYGIDRTFLVKVKESSCKEFSDLMNSLKQNDNFEYAEMNLKLKADSFDDPLFNSDSFVWGFDYPELWGLNKIEAPAAWDFGTGNGAVVAVVDSGVDYNHPDLWYRIWLDPNLVEDINNDGSINLDDVDLNANHHIEADEIIEGMFGLRDYIDDDIDPIDIHGHGTHVAGTIAASANNSKGIVGVAPSAKLMIVRVLGAEGSGDISGIVNAMVDLTDFSINHPELPHLITNSSLGAYGDSYTLKDAYDYASDMGLINFAAAGNANSGVDYHIPSSYRSTISVASTTVEDRRSGFSNYGNTVDVAAPGGGDAENGSQRNIVSTMAMDSYIVTEKLKPEDIISVDETQPNYGYVAIAGTSMATPHAAGVGALLSATRPNLTTLDMKSIMHYAVDPVVGDVNIGGRINAYEAVTLDSVPPLAMIDGFTINYDIGDDVYYYENGEISLILEESYGLNGTVFGENLAYASLSYKANNMSSVNLSMIDNQVMDSRLISGFDITRMPYGKVDFELEAVDNQGRASKDQISAFVENIVIENLMNNDVVSNSNIDIKAKLNINDFSSVQVQYKKSSDLDYWQDQVVTLKEIDGLSNGSQLIASIDASNLEADDFYDFKIRIERRDNPAFEKVIRLVYISSQFKPAFPVQIDRSKLDNYYSGIRDAIFYNNLSSYQAVEVADLDGDGLKEIITKIVFDTASGHNPIIRVYKNNGSLLWEREFAPSNLEWNPILKNSPVSNSVDELAIADLNDDGTKEIIVDVGLDGYEYESMVYALDYQGNDLPGWPLSLYGYIHGRESKTTVVADLDNDGSKEILMKQNSLIDTVPGAPDPDTGAIEQVRVLTIVTSDAKVRKRILIPFCDYYVKTTRVNESIAVGNFDNDSDLEVVTQYGCNQIAAYNMDGSLVAGWPFTPNGHVQSGFSVADIDKDGFDEISFTTVNRTESYRRFANGVHAIPAEFLNQRNQIYLLDKNANPVAGWPVYLGQSELDYQDGPHEGDFTLPVFADIDNDGDLEISLPCQACEYQQYLFHHDGTNVDGWPLNLVDDPRTSAHYSNPKHKQFMNTIADINNDGQLDIINVAGGIQFFEPGQEDFTKVGGVFAWNTDGSLIDLNPHPDINALVIEYDNLKDTQGQSVIIDDIDGDSKVDIVYANQLDIKFTDDNPENNLTKRRSSIYVWSLDSAVTNGSIAWSRVGHDLENSYRLDSGVEIQAEVKEADLFQRLIIANDIVSAGSNFVIEFQARSKPGTSIYSAYNVVGQVQVPDEFELVPEESDGCSQEGSIVSCDFFRIDAGKMKRRYLSFRAPTVDAAKQYDFTGATVASQITSGPNFTIDPVADPYGDLRITVVPGPMPSERIADLVQRLDIDKRRARSGDIVSLRLKAQSKDTSTHSAYDVVGEIDLPEGLIFLEDQSPYCSVNPAGTKLTCRFFRMDPGQSSYRTIKFQIPEITSRTPYVFRNVTVRSRMRAISPRSTIDPVLDTPGQKKVIAFPN